ncbi:rootletin-like [Paramacrobiotus metropolitanus]|uniref:rootletin-like n=1 Tax=Paramacrobiotus metropolitanus TaxID=2943436 RepID=UPI002445EF90|nr:rootletin-like [Paramacrobiotus metropolitanus]
MSFKTAMKEADRAQGLTPFEDIPESLIERNQTGKIVNVRSPSPNSPTSNLKKRVRELETLLEEKEAQVIKKKQEYQSKLGSLQTHIYELEQQQGVLETKAEEWKVRYERQVQIAKESVKIADDREMEGYIAVNELNESMSEETAERSRHIAELKDQCDELRKKADEAEEKRTEYATKLAEATKRLSTVNKDMFKLRNDLKSRDENIETLQKESADHQKRADDAVKVAHDLRDLLATEGERLKDEIKQVTEENAQLKEAGEKAAEWGQRWEEEARRLDMKVTKVEVESKEHQKKIRELTDENIKLNTEIVDMTQTVMTHQDEVTQSRTRLKSAADAYAQLEQQMNQLIDQIKARDGRKELNAETIQRRISPTCSSRSEISCKWKTSSLTPELNVSKMRTRA